MAGVQGTSSQFKNLLKVPDCQDFLNGHQSVVPGAPCWLAVGCFTSDAAKLAGLKQLLLALAVFFLAAALVIMVKHLRKRHFLAFDHL